MFGIFKRAAAPVPENFAPTVPLARSLEPETEPDPGAAAALHVAEAGWEAWEQTVQEFDSKFQPLPPEGGKPA